MPPASPVDRHAHQARAMPRLAAPLLVASLVSAAAFGSMTACSLDWTVRDTPADANDVVEGGPDVVADAPASETAADSGPDDAPASPDSSVCDGLAADVANARKKARECQIGTAGQCTTTVDDECGCKVIVRTAGSTDSTAYTDAVAALLASCGKPAACTTTACPQIGVPASWACLVVNSETRCTP